MFGTMMNYQLTLPHILERAGKLSAGVEIVSRLPDKSLHRHTYADFYKRARALAEALQKAGLQRGDRVGTLMWNHYAHLEAYFGIPVAGGVLHTLNLRLAPADIAYIMNHAGDRFLIVDDVLLPLYEKFKDQVKVERVIVVPLTGKPVPDGMENYETFLGQATGDFKYPDLKEEEALGMCYTSGTTGRPKGVVYSHRAVMLHSLALNLPDMLCISQRDTVLPVVPMFHVNAWGLPFSVPMAGGKLVFPGPYLDPASLLDLFQQEQVTFAAGVPTIWLGILQALDKNPGGWKLVPGMRMIVGGAAAPESMIRAFDKHNLQVVHAWGMTEMTPLGAASQLKPHLDRLSEDERYAYRAKQGLQAPFVDIRAMNEDGEVPWDGHTMGELQVRGPWVARNYYQLADTQSNWTEDGWLCTGDVVVIDPEGYIKITDRTKDLINSGGEWISSIDLENTLMGHPAVAEAAVIAIPDPKWQERPLALIVKKPEANVTADELRHYLKGRFVDWWLPNGYVFVDQLPRASTGKILKSALREQFHDYKVGAEE